MELNIETKDVQKTEYLDKNGLDMLWAKIKENTHNQVEVERNRAVAKENSIIDTKADKSTLDNYVLTTALAEYAKKTDIPAVDTSDFVSKTITDAQSIKSGLNVSNNLNVVDGNNESLIDLSIYNTPYDTHTNSSIAVKSFFDGIVDGEQTYQKGGCMIEMVAGDQRNPYILISTGTENSYTGENEIRITKSGIIQKSHMYDGDTNYYFAANGTVNDIYNTNNKDIYRIFDDISTNISNEGVSVSSWNNLTEEEECVTIKNSGISITNGRLNEVFAADGSIADLSQYAKKSEITAGGNVDDVQINGVSIIENKIANIKHATKESLGVVKVGYGLNVADGTISVNPEYLIDIMSYGVEWDTTVADPTCTRIGNQLYHKLLPIQSLYKGCLVKNGVVNYYLDPNDWSKKADGTSSILDGTDGDVMIHTPKFYGKSGSNGNKRWVRIATTKIDSSWVEIPEMFISAYRNTIYNDGDTTKIASVVSVDAKYRGGGRRSEYDLYLSTDLFKTDLGKPVSNINIATMRTYAAATGQELLCYEFYKWIFYWNYVIEYANFNSLKEFNSELTSDGYHLGGLGPGLTTWDWSQWSLYNENYAITPCGYTNEFGNFSGVKAILLQSPEKTLYANRWRGFENPFGDIWTNLEGIVIKRDVAKANSNVYTTTDASKYGEDYSLFDIAGVEIAQDGWIGTFDLGSKAEIIPSSIAGSESTYKCDYHLCNVNSVEKRTLLVGSYAHHGGSAGLGCFCSTDKVGIADATIGFRSVIRA